MKGIAINSVFQSMKDYRVVVFEAGEARRARSGRA